MYLLHLLDVYFFIFYFPSQKYDTPLPSKVYVMHTDAMHFYLPCFFRSPVWIRRYVASCFVRYTQSNPRAAIVRHAYGIQYDRFLFESRKNPDVSDSDRIVAPVCFESLWIQFCDGRKNIHGRCRHHE